MVVYLGTTIGNFDHDGSVKFLTSISHNLKPRDLLLLGADLVKNIHVMRNVRSFSVVTIFICKSLLTSLQAYDDSDGISRRLDLHLLETMNKELGANFNLEWWHYSSHYNVHEKQVECWIQSRKPQMIEFKRPRNFSISFAKWEPVLIFFSRKFTRADIEKMGSKSGFQILEHFVDGADYFVDSLFEKQP
jgi:L-histidine Nalpha-methyltransferase